MTTDRRIRVHRLGSVQDGVSNPLCGDVCPKHLKQDCSAGYAFGTKPYKRCKECLMIKEVARGFSYLASVERDKVFRRLAKTSNGQYFSPTARYALLDQIMDESEMEQGDA